MLLILTTKPYRNTLSERLEIFMDSSSFACIIPGIAAIIYAAVLYIDSKVDHVLIWAICAAIISAFESAACKLYKRKPETLSPQNWVNLIIFICLLMGVLWALIPIFFFIESNDTVMIVSGLFVLGLLSGAVLPMSFHPTTYYAIAFPVIIAFVIRCFSFESQMLQSLGLIGIAYIYFCLGQSRAAFLNIHEIILYRNENKELLEKLKAKSKKIEEASIAKSKVFAAASHDLRQPLHAMGLFFSSLKPELNSDHANLLMTKIDQTYQHLKNVLDSLLDISKLDASVVNIRLKHFYFQGILDELKNEFGPVADEKGIQLILTKANYVLYSDPILLSRIIRNLLSNAIKFTEEGQVYIKSQIENDQLKVQIIDHGPGIPEQDQANIFDEFYQVNNREKSQQQGLGLGLSIVRRLASLIDIDVILRRSVPGETIFELNLALGKEEFVVAKAPSSENIFDKRFNGIKALVIDDDVQILEGMAEVLKNWNIKVYTAESSNQAIARLEKDSAIDLIISDYQLQNNENGIDLIEKLKQQFSLDLPTLIITGDTECDTMSSAFKQKIPMIHKPVKPAQLRMAINSILPREKKL